MNYDLPLRYLSRAWFHQPARISTSKVLAAVSETLGVDFELGSMMRIDPQAGVGGTVTALVSRESGWQLIAAQESVDLELHNANKANLSLTDFLRKAADVMAIVGQASALPAHRLASVSEGFLRQMSDEEKD